MTPDTLHLLADLVLTLHVVFVTFVVIGLVLILAGGIFSWRWVRNPWFRWLHLAAIVIVVLQTWLGVNCPLTILEMYLRARAGDAAYHETFIAHWLQRLLYFEAPPWCFTVAYTAFALLVLAAWWWVKPRPFRKLKPSSGGLQ